MQDTILLGNSLEAWVVSLVLFVLITILLYAARRILSSHLRLAAARYGSVLLSQAADMLSRTHLALVITISLALASRVLVLHEDVTSVLTRLAVTALLIQAASWGGKLIGFAVNARVRALPQEDKTMVASLNAIGSLGQIALYVIILLLVLANLGVEVTALVASVGIGGIALAMASQNVLSDLFAFVSIVLDKPFVPGEFIAIGEFSGSVEQVGLRTTRIRSITGEQLLVSNRDLLQSRIRNYGRMARRRVVSSFGVTYQTSYQKLALIPGIIRQIISDVPEAEFDRAHFKKFGDFSLDFEYVYHVTPPAYDLFMDIQQHVNLEIIRRFNEERIEFAYPTQSNYVMTGGSGGDRQEAKTGD